MLQNNQIHITQKADEDLENIYHYSAKKFGLKRAIQYIRDLDKAFDKLARDSTLGYDCGYISPSLKSHRVISHLIFYKFMANKIVIIRILHKSMNYKQHF